MSPRSAAEFKFRSIFICIALVSLRFAPPSGLRSRSTSRSSSCSGEFCLTVHSFFFCFSW